MIGIYKITNLKNGKSYVGQSTDIEKRFRQHLGKNATGHGEKFAEDLKRYGKTAFSLQVLEECEKDRLLELEHIYINKIKPEYNEVRFGEKRDSVFRMKVSKGVKKWWEQLDDETKKKVKSNLTGPKIGHNVSDETKEKLRQANLGKKQSKETIEKRKISLKTRFEKTPKDGSGHFKKVGCENGITYESVKACAEHLNVHPSTVSSALKRKNKVRGYKVWYVV